MNVEYLTVDQARKASCVSQKSKSGIIHQLCQTGPSLFDKGERGRPLKMKILQILNEQDYVSFLPIHGLKEARFNVQMVRSSLGAACCCRCLRSLSFRNATAGIMPSQPPG